MIAIKMIHKGMDVAQIIEYTELTSKHIEALRKNVLSPVTAKS